MLIPAMPAGEVVETIVAAEQVGLDYCVLADETLSTDVYAALGAAARRTSRIRLGPVTNGYTRHPAVTATAIATLNELSEGRAMGVLVGGGSMALGPLGMRREAPAAMVAESIEVLRRLWTGEPVTWAGDHVRLDGAQLGMGRQEIPLWIAARGPRLLRLAGRAADGVILEVKADLPAALALVEAGAADSGRRPDRVYLDRLAYRPEQHAGHVSEVFVHVLIDSPTRQLRALGLGDDEIDAFRTAYRTDGPAAAATHITPELVRRHQIVGSPAECADTIRDLVTRLDLDVFMFYVKSPGLEDNVQMMRDIHAIVERAGTSVGNPEALP
jgi:5,10-methylenetetrahydromethanopterin reductase